MTEAKRIRIGQRWVVDRQRCLVCGEERSVCLLTLNGFDVRRCWRCRFVFSAPLPTDENLRKFYRDFAERVPASAPAFHRQLAVAALNVKLKVGRDLGVEPIRRLLDYGCGRGFYVAAAGDLGIDACGVDLDETVEKYAQQTLGARVFTSMENADCPDNSLDVVLMRHVIEHLLDPSAVLRKLVRALRPGGLLIVETPNTASLERFVRLRWIVDYRNSRLTMPGRLAPLRFLRCLVGAWGYVEPPKHLYGFRASNLRTLLQSEGLQVRRILNAGFGDPVYDPLLPGGDFHTTQKCETERRVRERLGPAFVLYLATVVPCVWVVSWLMKRFKLDMYVVAYAVKREAR